MGIKVPAFALGASARQAGLNVNETANRRISNIELIFRSFYFNWDRAKRYHPSTFYIRNSVVLRFAVPLTLNGELRTSETHLNRYSFTIQESCW